MKYDEERIERLLKLLQLGTPIKHACAAVGISTQTFYNWKKDNDEFDSRVREAESAFMNRNMINIEKAARGTLKDIVDDNGRATGKTTGKAGDWRASAWILEKRFPKEFGHLQRFEFTGNVQANLGFNDEELGGLASRILDKNKPKPKKKNGSKNGKKKT